MQTGLTEQKDIPMEQVDYTLILLIIIVPLLLASLLYNFSLNKKYLELRHRHDDLRKNFYDLEATCDQLNEKIALSLSFSESLKQAEVTTTLQTPRTQRHSFSQPPENKKQKYQHLQSLSASGMAASEIAAILSISNHEAEQMLSLAKIANKS